MVRYPFTCLVARGSHSHHPLKPNKLPTSITEDFILSLQQGDILSITPRRLRICLANANLMLILCLGRFRLTPQYQWLLTKYNASSLRAIHLALACEDRQWAIIRMLRLQRYPVGTHLLGISSLIMLLAYTNLCSTGIQRELSIDKQRSNEEQWFREVWYSDCEQYFIIVCCTKEQAIHYQKCRHAQIDCAFKMVAGRTMVFSLCGWEAYAKCMFNICYTYTELMF